MQCLERSWEEQRLQGVAHALRSADAVKVSSANQASNAWTKEEDPVKLANMQLRALTDNPCFNTFAMLQGKLKYCAVVPRLFCPEQVCTTSTACLRPECMHQS